MKHTDGNKMPELIALTGLDGTGKGHLAAHLRDEYGFLAVGASEILREAKTERPDLMNLHPDEAARQLKLALGPTFITDHAVALFEASRDTHTGLVIDGIRRLPEIERVKERGGMVLNISADPYGRFARLSTRSRSDAPKTIEDMLARDAAQMDGDVTDINSLNMRAIMGLADDIITNRFDSSFYDEAIGSLKRLHKP